MINKSHGYISFYIRKWLDNSFQDLVKVDFDTHINIMVLDSYTLHLYDTQ